MIPSEEFLRHAAECEYMSGFRTIQRARLYGVAWPRDGFGAPNLPRNKTHPRTIAAKRNYIASPPTLSVCPGIFSICPDVLNPVNRL